MKICLKMYKGKLFLIVQCSICNVINFSGIDLLLDYVAIKAKWYADKQGGPVIFYIVVAYRPVAKRRLSKHVPTKTEQ
jgi:hypothetical protein